MLTRMRAPLEGEAARAAAHQRNVLALLMSSVTIRSDEILCFPSINARARIPGDD